MKSFDGRFLFVVSVCALCVFTITGVSSASPADKSAGSICARNCGNIQCGSTRDSVATSHSVERILAECANVYRHVDSFYAKGRHLAQIKIDASRQILREQDIEIAYEKPNKISIVCRDPSGRATSRFVADGHRVLMVWDKQMRLFGGALENLTYRIIPEPPSLSAFVDEENHGDLFDDESGCLSASAVGPLLLSRDTLAWIHSHVVEYYYDGVETVSGHCCHRIRFHQNSPEIAVTQWIDCQTGLLRKLVVVRAQTERGTPAWALTAGASGEMWATVFNEITTGTLPKGLTFRADPPGDISESRDEVLSAPAVRSSGSTQSFLQRLLRAAARPEDARTSVALEKQEPTRRWRVGNIWTFEKRIISVSSGSLRELLLTTADAQVWRLAQKGLQRLPMALDFYPDIAVPWTGGGEPQVILARTGSRKLVTVGLDGRPRWQRTLASRLWCLTADSETSPSRLWLGLENSLALLDADGQTIFSTRRARNVAQIITATHPDYGKVLACIVISKPELWLFRLNGSPLELLQQSDALLGMEAVKVPSEIFLVGAISREGNELALRGLDRRGRSVWTTYITPRQERLAGDFTSYVDRGEELPHQYFVAVTPHGWLREVSCDGTIVWNGKLVIDPLSTIVSSDTVGDALTAADLNSDDSPELYVVCGKALIQLERESVAGSVNSR
ncbi:MAG: hypothetical protein N2Z21_10470 [Candidatus Sumerlaeaceae bacterium]|nr:hypothetical protein [Candidatus Sumerlaeaceae bacterium]